MHCFLFACYFLGQFYAWCLQTFSVKTCHSHMPYLSSTNVKYSFDKVKRNGTHLQLTKRNEIVNISQVHLNIIKTNIPFYKPKAQQEHFTAQKGTDKPLKHSLNTSNWNVEWCVCGKNTPRQTGQRSLSAPQSLTGGCAKVPKCPM